MPAKVLKGPSEGDQVVFVKDVALRGDFNVDRLDRHAFAQLYER